MTEEAPPELIVDAKAAPGDSSQGSGSGMAPFVLTAGGAGLLAKFVSPIAALVLLGLAVLAFVVLRRPGEGRFVLRVKDGVLDVTRERRTESVASIALSSLVDVTLDRQTRPAAGGRGGPTERVRIALERASPADPVFVPDDPITPVEGQEWHGRVRVFLRKHGWVPEDEQGPSSH